MPLPGFVPAAVVADMLFSDEEGKMFLTHGEPVVWAAALGLAEAAWSGRWASTWRLLQVSECIQVLEHADCV